MKLEIIADSVESALLAQNAGADRIELCEDLLEGGITPSYGLIEQARKALTIDLFVMIRPRGGDFLYSASEYKVMKSNIEVCKNLGADGVVIGMLKSDGEIDIERSKELVDLARPLGVTFHRAFDHTPEPLKALDDIIATGADRILTSGHKKTAVEGKVELESLASSALNRIIIMPGSGITSKNIDQLSNIKGIREFHSSAKTIGYSKMKFKNESLQMGRGNDDEFSFFIVDPEEVMAIKNKLITNN